MLDKYIDYVNNYKVMYEAKDRMTEENPYRCSASTVLQRVLEMYAIPHNADTDEIIPEETMQQFKLFYADDKNIIGSFTGLPWGPTDIRICWKDEDGVIILGEGQQGPPVPKHAVTVTCNEPDVVLTGAGQYPEGGSYTITLTPKSGRRFAPDNAPMVNGVPMTPVGSNKFTYTGTMGDTDVAAAITGVKLVEAHPVNITLPAAVAAKGKITGNGTYEAGKPVTITVEPKDSTFAFGTGNAPKVNVPGVGEVTLTQTNPRKYTGTFTMPDNDVAAEMQDVVIVGPAVLTINPVKDDGTPLTGVDMYINGTKTNTANIQGGTEVNVKAKIPAGSDFTFDNTTTPTINIGGTPYTGTFNAAKNEVTFAPFNMPDEDTTTNATGMKLIGPATLTMKAVNPDGTPLTGVDMYINSVKTSTANLYEGDEATIMVKIAAGVDATFDDTPAPTFTANGTVCTGEIAPDKKSVTFSSFNMSADDLTVNVPLKVLGPKTLTVTYKKGGLVIEHIKVKVDGADITSGFTKLVSPGTEVVMTVAPASGYSFADAAAGNDPKAESSAGSTAGMTYDSAAGVYKYTLTMPTEDVTINLTDIVVTMPHQIYYCNQVIPFNDDGSYDIPPEFVQKVDPEWLFVDDITADQSGSLTVVCPDLSTKASIPYPMPAGKTIDEMVDEGYIGYNEDDEFILSGIYPTIAFNMDYFAGITEVLDENNTNVYTSGGLVKTTVTFNGVPYQVCRYANDQGEFTGQQFINIKFTLK